MGRRPYSYRRIRPKETAGEGVTGLSMLLTLLRLDRI